MISNNEFDDWGQQANNNGPAQNSEDPSVDLMQVALRRKGLIALGVFLGLCLGLLYFARATPMYETSARLSIQEQANALQSPNEMDFGIGYSKANDHAIRIHSQRIISDTLKDNPDLETLPSLIDAESAIVVISEGLSVVPVEEGSEVLELTYKGTNAEDCAQILDAIMATYTGFLNKKRKDIGSVVVASITEARQDLQIKKDKLLEEYEEWRKNDSRLFGAQGINLAQEELATIKKMIFEEELRISSLSNEIDSLKSAMELGVDPMALMIMAQQDGRTMQLEDDEIERRLQRAEDLREQRVEVAMLEDEDEALRYGPDHPRRRSLKRRINLAEDLYEQKLESIGSIDEETGEESDETTERILAYITSLEQTVKEGEGILKQWRIQEKEKQDEASALSDDEAQRRYYEGEIDRQEALFTEVVNSLQEIDLSEQYGNDEKFRIEQLGEPGIGEQTDPSLAKSLAAGTMLGFLAGFGLGYLVEMFDKTFRNPQEVSDMLQLPMIGHIPEIIPEPVEDTKLSDTLIAAHKPKSPLAENFRAIRTALYFSTGGQQNTVIQTTSPVPGDGKSTLTANLAITIAQSNKSVLLVDADFRRPTQHKLFGATNDTGLASVVVGEADPLEAAQATEVPNLYVMACGPRPHNPSELLTSPQFADLIEVLREQYDFVLIDTPPVLAVTDPGIVSARVDGVIMALRIRKNGRPGAVRARKILRDLDANMLGIVVNGIDQRGGAYGYYSNYRRGYGGYGGYGAYGKTPDKTEKLIGKYFEEPPEETTQVPGTRG